MSQVVSITKPGATVIKTWNTADPTKKEIYVYNDGAQISYNSNRDGTFNIEPPSKSNPVLSIAFADLDNNYGTANAEAFVDYCASNGFFLEASGGNGASTTNVPVSSIGVEIDFNDATKTEKAKTIIALNALPATPLTVGAVAIFVTTRIVLANGEGIELTGQPDYAIVRTLYTLTKPYVNIGSGIVLTEVDVQYFNTIDSRNVAPTEFDLGDIATADVWDFVTANGPYSTPNSATVIFRAIQNGTEALWLYLGQEEEIGTGFSAVVATDFRLFPVAGAVDPEVPAYTNQLINNGEDGVNPFIDTTSLQAPYLEEVRQVSTLPSNPTYFILKGSYFTENMTVVIEGNTITSTLFIDDNTFRVNLTTIATEGSYDLTLDNNNGTGAITYVDKIQIVTGTLYIPSSGEWIDLTRLDVSQEGAAKITVFQQNGIGIWTQELDYTKDWLFEWKMQETPLGDAGASGNGDYVADLQLINGAGSQVYGAEFRPNPTSVLSVYYVNGAQSDFAALDYADFFNTTFTFKYVGGLMTVLWDGVLKDTLTPITLTENLRLKIICPVMDTVNIKYIDLSVAGADKDVRDKTSTLNNVGEDGINPFISSSAPDTGAVLSLTKEVGILYNMAAANTATTYTTTGTKISAFARVLINAATEPVVTGGTKIAGSDFAASTDMYMTVWYNGTNVQFWFEAI